MNFKIFKILVVFSNFLLFIRLLNRNSSRERFSRWMRRAESQPQGKIWDVLVFGSPRNIKDLVAWFPFRCMGNSAKHSVVFNDVWCPIWLYLLFSMLTHLGGAYGIQACQENMRTCKTFRTCQNSMLTCSSTLSTRPFNFTSSTHWDKNSCCTSLFCFHFYGYRTIFVSRLA